MPHRSRTYHWGATIFGAFVLTDVVLLIIQLVTGHFGLWLLRTTFWMEFTLISLILAALLVSGTCLALIRGGAPPTRRFGIDIVDANRPADGDGHAMVHWKPVDQLPSMHWTAGLAYEVGNAVIEFILRRGFGVPKARLDAHVEEPPPFVPSSAGRRPE